MDYLSTDILLAQPVSGMQEKPAIQCCCGSLQCAFLEHNSTVLEGLEKDLLSAARIGQALLIRHESHMAEAEEERQKMAATIDQLESDKRQLEISNAKIITENRQLLDQLEDINNRVMDSNSHIDALTTTLASTRQELNRLTVLAGRAAQLEAQLGDIEVEHAELELKFSSTREESRSTIQRWRRAEGTINYLQDQIARIEKEAREERERHVEVLERLDRRRIVERELESAAGRLKGAAAAKSLKVSTPQGNNVVSHFVRDILQDNANLQLGVVELREMLAGSNAEVESLREQLILHQPLESETSTLKAELEESMAAEEPMFEPIPELHVYHHYQEPKVSIRKAKKKKVTNGHFIPSGAITPRQQRVKNWRVSTSSAATILSQTSATLPPNRWSAQSGASFAPSSIPSSPRRTSSVFDSLDSAFDSRPSTPGSSIVASSPPVQSKGNERILHTLPYLSGHRSVSAPGPVQPSRSGLIVDTSAVGFTESGDSLQHLLNSPHSTIPEEVESNKETAYPGSLIKPLPILRHRRTTSHDSLLSIASVSKPLKAQLSQNFDISGSRLRSILYSPTTASTPTEATVTHATVTAEDIGSPTISAYETGGVAQSLLFQARTSSDDQLSNKKPLAGWILGKWGKAPLPSSISTAGPPRSPVESALRSPGVNQVGFIRGLIPPQRTPSNVQPITVDESALREALAE